MAETDSNPTEKRIAVVTGANKGIGLEICRQLASKGVIVILTARDEKKGARQQLLGNNRHEMLSEYMQTEHRSFCYYSGRIFSRFHQLDVTDHDSIASLADSIKTQLGKLDILINNAGISGVTLDLEALKASKPEDSEEGEATNGAAVLIARIMQHALETSETAEECMKTNYYGTKRVTEALIPLLLATNSARIVNISSRSAQLRFISNQSIREELRDIDGLTEERLDELLQAFLNDLKEGLLEVNGWAPAPSAYRISKSVLNAYMRVQAKRHPSLSVMCVCPGFVKTDINYNFGTLPVEVGAESAVMLALLPDGCCPSGLFFEGMEEASF